MNRLPFVGKKRLYRHARIASRWRRRGARGNREETVRLTRSNPGGGFMSRVVEAAKEFKRKHGGQAYGWAADQASMAPRGEKQRFWAEVASLLKRDLYATNPKRYSRQARKKVKHRGEQRRANGKLARANKRYRHHTKRYLSSKRSKHRRRSYKWDTSLQYWGDKASDWYARRNNPRKPVYSQMGYCPICNRALPDGSTTEHVALGERPSKRFCFRKEFGHDTNCDRIARGLRANPKRDGTATRGEKRKDKYKDYLRSLREKGEKASAELNKLLGRGVHKPHGEVVLKAPTTATQAEHPGHYAAELSSDQKFAQESISQLEATMADIRTQMRDLGDDDEALADEFSDRLINLGDQKRALLARVKGTPVATNPRRGRNPRYTSPARYRRMSTEQRARYRRALRLLRATVHHFRY